MRPRGLGKREMLAEARVTWRQLDHWTRLGYLRTLSEQIPGIGHDRIWPSSEVQIARTMARLTAAGITPEGAERVARGKNLAPGIRVLIDQIPPE
jgi:hypothetical protein